jgi:KDO2-lipid IV(A) lauroyltransferase
VLGGRQRNPLVEDRFSRLRERRGLRTLVVGKSLRPLVETFAAGRCVATLADQDGGPDGFFVEFLGRPASVQAGLFRLIARRGIPLVLGFAERAVEGWRAVIHPPVLPAPASTADAAEAEARRLATLYTGRVEEAVRRRPDHWFWVHRRWKSRPRNGPVDLGDSTQSGEGR